MGRFELTFEEFDRFCAATGRELIADHGWGRGRRPATKIVGDDAVAYAEWLNAQTGKRYRIPTEAEWERVADCWHDSYAGALTDCSAHGGSGCENHVMRGGSCGYNSKFMRASSRVKVFWGVLSFLYYGVRVVRDID